MFQATFYDFAYNSPTATIPEGLFDSITTTNGIIFSNMFYYTFSNFAYNSPTATIPEGLFDSIATTNGTDFIYMFCYTFYNFAYNSPTATIPEGLFDSIATTNGTDFSNMFYNTFSCFAYNSTTATIPEGLFDTITTTNGTDFGGMFRYTFSNFAYNSPTATIPEGLFDSITTTNGTNFIYMFNSTFYNYARRTSTFKINGSTVGSVATFTNLYSVKIGADGTPSTNPTVDATTASQVIPTYNATTRTISAPSGYTAYTWFRTDGTSCAVTEPTEDCGEQNASTLVTFPNTTEWTPITSTEKGNVTFYGALLPTVSSVSPSIGSTSGGTIITITGENFTGATAVTIGGSACSSFVVNSATSITCIAPSGVAGSASVVVTTPDGASAANTLFTYITPPSVTNILPNEGLVEGGTEVTITGTNFGNTIPSSDPVTTVLGNYDTCGTPQAFTAPTAGLYKLETWGAQGGQGTSASYPGGKGGYSTGEVTLNANDTIYVYVGCAGATKGVGGWNGGGTAYTGANYAGGGGGATDMRLVKNSDPVDTTSLQSRIIVAGAGGGHARDSSPIGGIGGGLTGTNGGVYNTNYTAATGGTQNSGGTGAYKIASQSTTTGTDGVFGIGGNANTTGGSYYGGGGGAGWYGGGGGATSGDSTSGAGGSGYIFTETSDKTGYSGNTPNSKYYLSNATTIDGATTNGMPDPSDSTGATMMTGKTGGGYARISSITQVSPVQLGTESSGYTSCDVTAWSNASITCITTAHAEGLVDVVVTDSNGLNGILTSGFNYYSIPYIDLAIDQPDVNFDITLDLGNTDGTLSSAKQTASFTTNIASGISLLASTATNNSNMVNLSDSSKILSPTTGTLTSLSPLSTNSWGFALADREIEHNNTNSSTTWAKMPNKNETPVTLKSTNTPNLITPNTTDIFYAAKVNKDVLAGYYGATIVYTAVANP